MPNLILIENEYPDEDALLHVLNYVLRSDLYGGYAVDPIQAYRQMVMVKNVYHKREGKQLLHFIVSFTTSEAYRVTIDEVLALGFHIAELFGEYQTVYAVHMDGSHIHIHMVMNSISFVDGHRYRDGLVGFWKVRSELEQLFPRSDVGLYRSFPLSNCNRYLEADANKQFLRIG